MWLFQVYFIPDVWRLIIPQAIQDFRPPFVIENICAECPRGPEKCCLVPYRIPNFVAGSAFTDQYTRDNITRILKNAESFDFVPRRLIAWKAGQTCPAYNFETGKCTSYKVRSVRCSVYYCNTDTVSPQWRRFLDDTAFYLSDLEGYISRSLALAHPAASDFRIKPLSEDFPRISDKWYKYYIQCFQRLKQNIGKYQKYADNLWFDRIRPLLIKLKAV